MASREQLEIALVNAHNAGDAAAAQKFAAAIQSGQFDDTGGVVGETLGGVETAGTVLTGAIAEPISGLAGLVQLGGSTVNNMLGLSNEDPAAAAANVVESVQNMLTWKPRTSEGRRNLQKAGEFMEPVAEVLSQAEKVSGDIGYDLTGPVGGGLASAIPAALLEVIPGAKLPKVVGKALESRGDVVAQQAAELEKIDIDPKIGDTLEEAAQVVKSGEFNDIAEIIAADPEFYKAADALGINTEPLASFASQNKQFRGIEQGLAAVGGSDLDAQSFEFIEEVANRADRLIEQFGGTLDKAELSERFKEKGMATVVRLDQRVDDLYNELDSKIDQTMPVEAPNIVNFLKDHQRKTGGLSPQASKLLNALEPKEVKTGRFDTVTGQEIIDIKRPSYGQLSQRRKEIGQALQKRSGVFSDEETGLLKKMYSDLRKDQDAILEQTGNLRVQKLADQLVVKRKRLEDNLIQTLGKDLSGSISTKAAQKIKRLSKGNVAEFKSFISKVPEKMREEVVVTALNDLMRGRGTGKEAFSTNQMAAIKNELDRQPKLKAALFEHLPKGAAKDFDNLGKLAQGIDRALKDKVRTGAVNALLNDETGFLRRMVGKVGATTLGAKIGVPFGGSAVEEFFKKTDRSEKVSKMLGSQEFQNMIMQAVRDGVVEGNSITEKTRKIQNRVEKSQAYKQWAKTLTDSEAATLASIGLVSYLLDPDENPQ